MIENAKPCPFCGSTKIGFVTEGIEGEVDYGLQVYCESCSTTTGGYASKKEAIAFWNTRAPVLFPVAKDRRKAHARDVTYD